MKRTTVYLRDDQALVLKKTAEASGQSEAELIRQGIDLIVQRQRPRPRGLRVIANSGDPTLADRTDEILAAGFGADGLER